MERGAQDLQKLLTFLSLFCYRKTLAESATERRCFFPSFPLPHLDQKLDFIFGGIRVAVGMQLDYLGIWFHPKLFVRLLLTFWIIKAKPSPPLQYILHFTVLLLQHFYGEVFFQVICALHSSYCLLYASQKNL